MQPPEQLYGENASIVITGASSGIGAALAVHLARYRGRLALVARRADELQQVADRVREAGGRPLVQVADVTSAESVREAAAQIAAAQGPVDVAFLNAGMGDVTSASRFDAARIKRLFEVNVFGVVHWLEALLPDMISRGRGIIAGTSSLSAARGLPGGGAYSASKAAVSALLESLRVDARRYGVRVIIIEPGYVKSDMTARNKVRMPFLMETEAAARAIADGVAEGRSKVRFPWQMAAVIQALRHLPDPLFDRLTRSWAKPRREPVGPDRGGETT